MLASGKCLGHVKGDKCLRILTEVQTNPDRTHSYSVTFYIGNDYITLDLSNKDDVAFLSRLINTMQDLIAESVYGGAEK